METPNTTYLKDYSPPAFHIETVNLSFHLDEESTTVTSVMKIRRNMQHASGVPLILDGEDLELVSVKLNSQLLAADAYQLENDHLIIHKVPDVFEITIVNKIKPQNNTLLSGLYKSKGNFCTQCEAHGFRRITYYLDRPDVMALFTTTINADKKKYPILLSNGNLIASGEEGNRHWVTWQDPFKKPCYLFALVAGDLVEIVDHFKTASGREVILKIFVEKGNQDKVEHALLSVKQAMRWDEEQFGREYDLDIYMIVAVSDFNMGAMENKGLNIFNDRYVLASPTVATDQDYEAVTSVIGHEYFHNWTGNRITCRDWFQLSLKEGLTVFRDQEFSASLFSPSVVRINEVRLLRARQFPEDSGPLAHPVRPESYIEINNFYTATVYNKGAELIRMMQTLLTPSGFRKGMDWYFEHYDGQAVTTEEFVKSMEEANQADLSQFRLWYSQAGTPEVVVTDEYDEKTQKYYLHMKQSCPPTPGQERKLPMHIPVDVALFSVSGEQMPLYFEGDIRSSMSKVISLKTQEASYCFEKVKSKPIPSLLRNFSAPVKLKYDYSEEDLLLLMENDTDGFNRFDASQRLLIKIIFQFIDDYQHNRKLLVPQKFIDALESQFTKVEDPALLAEMLVLPSENYLATLMPVVDVEAIHHARQFLKKTIARHLQEIFFAAYQTEFDFKAYSLKDAGKRRLKNICLDYLVSIEDEAFNEICLNQFERASNMTDQLASFSAFVNSDNNYRLAAIDDFYQQWRHEPLVIDKWFSIQALSSVPDTMMRVSMLALHPDFNIQNPNRVRSLVGAFSSGNHYYFHLPTGEGYRFLSEMVLRLDAINPQVAARLLDPLTHWRRYDSRRQDLMRAELERIKRKPGLSRDVFELVSKSLS